MQYVVLLLIISLQFLLPLSSKSQEKVLEQAIHQFNQIEQPAAYTALNLQFEQLYAADPSNWLIPYYAALINARMCLLKMGDRDQLANRSLAWVAKAKLMVVNDELYCAESLANTAKMSVNPMMRWLSYEEKIKRPLQLAKKINPKNPRVYLLEAQLQYNLPVFFGGGCKAAKPIIQQAEQNLLREVTPNLVAPSWGRQALVELKKACPY